MPFLRKARHFVFVGHDHERVEWKTPGKKELLGAFFFILVTGFTLSSSLNHKRPWIRLIDIAFNILREHYGPQLWASIRPINKVQAGSHLAGSKTWPPKLTYFYLTLSPVSKSHIKTNIKYHES